MSASLLREAAALMRERATGARNNNPWLVDSDRPNVVLDPDKPGNDWDGLTVCEVPLADGGLVDFPTVEHIASWHPAVALAVADWLEDEADAFDAHMDRQADPERRMNSLWLHAARARHAHALADARAYLGESS